jgi:hypothetical protein
MIYHPSIELRALENVLRAITKSLHDEARMTMK